MNHEPKSDWEYVVALLGKACEELTKAIEALQRVTKGCQGETVNVSKRVLVTNDKWVKLKGRLDPNDEALMKEAAEGGELVVMNIREALEAMKAAEPDKFQQFHKEMERRAGIPLTPEQLVEFAQMADRRFAEFTKLTEAMTKEQAKVVRKLRVEERCSWRAVARTCYILGMGRWSPSSNQIMGMALCQRAAQILGEDFQAEPWN